MLSLAARFRWTDTTQGFRAYSAALLRDPRLAIFRDVFDRESVTNYDVFPNGRELLMVRKNSGTLSAAVLLDWTQLLERRAAVPN